MGRTIITPAKKKLAKEEIRNKNKEIHKQEVDRISKQIKSCKEFEVDFDPWIIPVIPLAPRRILEALVKTIILLWFIAIRRKTGAGNINEEINQIEGDQKVKKAKSKQKKTWPKKSKNQNLVRDRSMEQNVEVTDSEEDEVLSETSLLTISTTTSVQVQSEQDNSGSWIVATSRRETKCKARKQQQLSPSNLTPVIQSQPRKKSSPKSSSRQPRAEPSSSFVACQKITIAVNQTPELTQEATPPKVNPWKKVVLDEEPASLRGIMEESKVFQAQPAREAKEDQKIEDSPKIQDVQELDANQRVEEEVNVDIDAMRLDSTEIFEEVIQQRESDLCPNTELMKLVEVEPGVLESSSEEETDTTIPSSNLSEADTVSTEDDKVTISPSEKNSCLSEVVKSDGLKAQDGIPIEVEDNITVKGDAATELSSKENNIPTSKRWADMYDEDEEENDEALDAIKAYMEKGNAARCNGQ